MRRGGGEEKVCWQNAFRTKEREAKDREVVVVGGGERGERGGERVMVRGIRRGRERKR